MNLKLSYSEKTNNIALDFLRMFLGIAIIGKGIFFVQNMNKLFELTNSAISYGDFILAHYIIFAHIVGGGCIFFGLLTRQAAMANIPILLGAVVFVHMKEGLFTYAQGLEISMMVFFLLCITLYHGSGRLSVDYYINKSYQQQAIEDFLNLENVLDLDNHRVKKDERNRTEGDDIKKAS